MPEQHGMGLQLELLSAPAENSMEKKSNFWMVLKESMSC